MLLRRRPTQAPAKTEIDHPLIGTVTVGKSRRARRISISVRPPGVVRLSLPYGVSVEEGMRFLESKTQWIARAKEKIGQKAPAPEPIGMPYSTRNHDLWLVPASTTRIAARLSPAQEGRGRIAVTYPADRHYTDPEVQQVILKGIDLALRAEACEILPTRVENLAAAHGFRYRSVTPRNTRTRWGSCSARNDISLSIKLMKLPDHLVDYIILHELCHTVHKNHGPRFHELLDRVTGHRHAALRRELHTHSPSEQPGQ